MTQSCFCCMKSRRVFDGAHTVAFADIIHRVKALCCSPPPTSLTRAPLQLSCDHCRTTAAIKSACLLGRIAFFGGARFLACLDLQLLRCVFIVCFCNCCCVVASDVFGAACLPVRVRACLRLHPGTRTHNEKCTHKHTCSQTRMRCSAWCPLSMIPVEEEQVRACCVCACLLLPSACVLVSLWQLVCCTVYSVEVALPLTLPLSLTFH